MQMPLGFIVLLIMWWRLKEWMKADLIEATREGHFRRVRYLLSQGAYIESRDRLGLTPLMWAVVAGYEDIVRYLLSNGADIEARDYRETTALMLAACCGHAEIVALLLEHGANIEAQDHRGMTALMFAAERGYMEAVTILLAQGAHLEARDHAGISALMKVAFWEHFEIVIFLLEQGASFEQGNPEQWYNRSPETGATPFSMHIARGEITQARALLTGYVNEQERKNLLNRPNAYGHTPLMRAIINHQEEAVGFLLREGAEIACVSNDPWRYSALYFALQGYFSNIQDSGIQSIYENILIYLNVYGVDVTQDPRSEVLLARHGMTLDDIVSSPCFVMK